MTSKNSEGLTVAAHDGKALNDQRPGSQIDPIDTLADDDGQHHRIASGRVIDSIRDNWAVFECGGAS
jgi:hypothetical protein